MEEPPPGQPTLRIGNVTVDEDGGPAEFTVTLSETSVDDVTVAYATEDGTAYAGSDYTTVSETLTIRAGSTTGTISVEVLDDEVIEGDERFAVKLSSASGATIVDSEGVGTIRDDDVEEPPPGQPTLEHRQCESGRGRWACGVHGDVERDERRRRDGGVCDRGRDGICGFGLHDCERDADDSSGETTGTISVEVLDDEVIEGDERFAVRLSSASGATIVDGEGVGTIRDDDVEEPPPGQPTLRIGNVRVDEDDGPAEFTVTLSETSGTT